jgi:hypothetical protein
MVDIQQRSKIAQTVSSAGNKGKQKACVPSYPVFEDADTSAVTDAGPSTAYDSSHDRPFTITAGSSYNHEVHVFEPYLGFSRTVQGGGRTKIENQNLILGTNWT